MSKKKDRVRFVKHVEKRLEDAAAKYVGGIGYNYLLTTTEGREVKIGIHGEETHKIMYSMYAKFTDTKNLPVDVNNKYSGKHNFHSSHGDMEDVLDFFDFYFNNLTNM